MARVVLFSMKNRIVFLLVRILSLFTLTSVMAHAGAKDRLETVLSQSIWPAISILFVVMVFVNVVIYYCTQSRSLHTRVLGMAAVLIIGEQIFGLMMHYKFDAIEVEMTHTQNLLPASNSIGAALRSFQRETLLMEKWLVSGEKLSEASLQKMATTTMTEVKEAMGELEELADESNRESDRELLRDLSELKEWHDQHTSGVSRLIGLMKIQGAGDLSRTQRRWRRFAVRFRSV